MRRLGFCLSVGALLMILGGFPLFVVFGFASMVRPELTGKKGDGEKGTSKILTRAASEGLRKKQTHLETSAPQMQRPLRKSNPPCLART